EIDGDRGLNFAGWAKKVTGAPTISVGSVGLNSDFISSFKGGAAQVSGLEGLIARMEREEFDLIAVGRALLSDPLWVEKIRDGRRDEVVDFDPAAMAVLA